MKRHTLFALAVCLGGGLLASSAAQAQRVSPLTGASFGRICTRTGPAGAQTCDAYITGMADAVALAKVNERNQGDANAPTGFCIPQTETGAAMRGKVLSWLKAHEEALKKPVGEGVFMALHEAYPCGGAK